MWGRGCGSGRTLVCRVPDLSLPALGLRASLPHWASLPSISHWVSRAEVSVGVCAKWSIDLKAIESSGEVECG